MKEAIINKRGSLLVVCIVFIVAGTIAWILMLQQGLLHTTGMGNIFNWGLLIAMFAFLVGFGAGGQFVASYIVLSKKKDLAPFAIIAQAIALGGGVGAGIAILADLGSPWNIFAMLMHPNPTSPLTWDMIALTSFIVVSFICLLSLGRSWKSARVWIVIGAVVALALQIVEGLLFALISARAWWHSFIMPVDFIVVAVVCGLAIMCVFCAISKRHNAMNAARAFSSMLFIAVIVHVVLSLLEVLMLVLEGTAASNEALSLIGSNIVLYAIEIGVSLIAVIALRINLDKATAKKIVLCAVFVIIAMFAHRLMLLYPAFGSATLFTALSDQASAMWPYPVSTGYFASAKETFALTQAYIPSFVEWISCLLPIGLAGFVTIVGYNVSSYWKRFKD